MKRLFFRAASKAARIPRFGAVAQLGERYNGIVEVRGSIPLGSTTLMLATLAAKRCRCCYPPAIHRMLPKKSLRTCSGHCTLTYRTIAAPEQDQRGNSRRNISNCRSSQRFVRSVGPSRPPSGKLEVDGQAVMKLRTRLRFPIAPSTHPT